MAREGQQISDETGPGFAGPILHGLLGLLEPRAEDQQAALDYGAELLAKGAVGHNHFWFRRYAIERALLDQNWREVQRHADELSVTLGDEPLAYGTLLIERAHILARSGLGNPASDDATRMQDLSAATMSCGMHIDALGSALLASTTRSCSA
jgi:hypothetical protein